MLHDLVVHPHSQAGRQGETHASTDAVLAHDGGVDADHFPGQVDQRAAGVAPVDGSVGLDETLKLRTRSADALARAPLVTDDAGGNGGAEAEGAADGQHPVAHLNRVRVAQLGRRQLAPDINLDHRQVGFLIPPDHLRVITFALPVQINSDSVSDFSGSVHNMVVGKDVAIGVHNHARPQAALCLRPARIKIEKILERPRRSLPGTGAAALGAAVRFGIDIHHRRLQLFRHLGKDGRQLPGGSNRQGLRARRGGVVARGSHAVGNQRAEQDPHRQRHHHRQPHFPFALMYPMSPTLLSHERTSLGSQPYDYTIGGNDKKPPL